MRVVNEEGLNVQVEEKGCNGVLEAWCQRPVDAEASYMRGGKGLKNDRKCGGKPLEVRLCHE